MSEFKPGDRVTVYQPEYIKPSIAIVESIRADTILVVRFEVGGVTDAVHPKQCRKLKPKAKRSEFWFNPNPIRHMIRVSNEMGAFLDLCAEKPQGDGWVRVREVRKPTKTR